MRILVIAVGRTRDAGFKVLWQDYAGRCQPPLELREVEDKKRGSASEVKEREGQLLLAEIPDRAIVVALDQRGRSLSSLAFARQIENWAERGIGDLAFLIGGADGLSEAVLARADDKLSLGAMTLPHQLARVVIAEQLYRAGTIRAGHPYHRE